MTTKTFDDIIQEGYQYPEIIPQDLQGVIYDWYQYRYVCDDEKFPVFFTRLLLKDYRQYEQLVRIEPGVAEYDWLVSQYKELQRENTDNETNVVSTEGNTATAETTSQEKDGTLTKTYNLTDAGTNTRASENEVNVTETIERDDTRTINGQDTKTLNLTDVTAKETSDSKVIDKDTSRTDVTDNDTSRTDVTDTDTSNTSLNDAKSVARSLPMSSSAVGTDSNYNVVSLDWGTASGQNQTTTRESGTGTVDTTVTSTGTNDTTLNSDIAEDTTETLTGSEDITLTKTGTEGNVNTGTDVLDSDEQKTRQETSEGGYTDTLNKTKTGTETDVNDETVEGSKNISVDKTEETTNTKTGSGRIREIMTGRNDQIALMLENAKQFIANTDAWDWLRHELDEVFMGVYEV